MRYKTLNDTPREHQAPESLLTHIRASLASCERAPSRLIPEDDARSQAVSGSCLHPVTPAFLATDQGQKRISLMALFACVFEPAQLHPRRDAVPHRFSARQYAPPSEATEARVRSRDWTWSELPPAKQGTASLHRQEQPRLARAASRWPHQLKTEDSLMRKAISSHAAASSNRSSRRLVRPPPRCASNIAAPVCSTASSSATSTSL
jgi:hypothetical protein